MRRRGRRCAASRATRSSPSARIPTSSSWPISASRWRRSRRPSSTSEMAAPGSRRIPVGLNVWSRLVASTFPYLDQTVAPFDSLWFPDHVQYGSHAVAEGWTLLAWALARYPDKLAGHEVLCNSFRNPAHLAKMAATAQALSGGRVILGI